VCWECDYPHSDSTWPNSPEELARELIGIPDDEVALVARWIAQGLPFGQPSDPKVERIEVLRGPAVLLFGGQAVGGAVNALDKRIPRAIPDEAVHVDALAGYGSAAHDWSGGASVDVPLTERVVVHLDGSYRNSDDLRTGGNILAPSLRAELLDFAAEEVREGHLDEAAEARELADQSGRIPNSAVKSWTAAGGIAFIDDGGNMGLSYSIYDTNYGIPARPGTTHAHGEGDAEEVPVTIGMRQYRFDFRGELDLGDGLIEKLRLRAGYANYSHTEFQGDEIGTIFNSKGFEGRAEFIQNDRGDWRGASGVQYQTRNLVASGAEAFVPPNKSRLFGLFTLQEFTVGNLDAEVALEIAIAQLVAEAHRLPQVPTYIVHGQRDLTCAPEASFAVHRAIPGSRLEILRTAGHLSGEPLMTDALLRAADWVAGELLGHA
jgi:iron complex outermembrane receptor protein